MVLSTAPRSSSESPSKDACGPAAGGGHVPGLPCCLGPAGTSLLGSLLTSGLPGARVSRTLTSSCQPWTLGCSPSGPGRPFPVTLAHICLFQGTSLDSSVYLEVVTSASNGGLGPVHEFQSLNKNRAHRGFLRLPWTQMPAEGHASLQVTPEFKSSRKRALGPVFSWWECPEMALRKCSGRGKPATGVAFTLYPRGGTQVGGTWACLGQGLGARPGTITEPCPPTPSWGCRREGAAPHLQLWGCPWAP